MIINIIYILIGLILLFISFLAITAISRGMEAKKKNRKEELVNQDIINNTSDEINKLKKMLDEGTISEEEFRAKKKVLEGKKNY